MWSAIVACVTCSREVSFYEALEAAAWVKADMRCPGCQSALEHEQPSRRREASPRLRRLHLLVETERAGTEPRGAAGVQGPDLAGRPDR